ncbi:cytochrome c biogenesis protein CcdA [Tenacibaculum sp. C7A-26P2]|uniref:protein-disulfide reductase DsbD family protein n=1 Tax=Tenacibaculum sp. C7A-26P2 TaxID=3447504 RepID=UPI003F878B53
MKKLITLFLFFIGFVTFSQTDDAPLEVTPSVKKVSDTEYDLIFEISIAEDWHLYSQFNPEDASLPMTISPAEGEEGYTLVGKAEESETETEFSEIWGKDEIFFVDEATLVQRITVQDTALTKIMLNLDAQVCKEFCLPFDEDFTFTFSLKGGEVVQTVTELDERSKVLSESLKLDLKNESMLKGATSKESEKKNSSLLNVFLLGFVGGLLAFLTPCVFPMIPLTVSFFTKKNEKNSKSGSGSALLYGFFIVLIYGLLSLPFHFLDTLDPEILNNISTNIWLNIFFFVVLVFFAGSFFGLYELTLPASWTNKADNASSVGGILGVFFMALTLAIVSFSCTGPILGSLLAGSLSSDGGAMLLTSGMVGFGLALSLPFAVFANFPKWMAKLPRSGSWLNTVKVSLGFLELALAFKFLSNADLVGHWNLLKREIFIGIWTILAVLMALYLFGLIGKKYGKVSMFRVLLGVLVLGIAVYLAPGVLQKPTWDQSQLLSGFAPPKFHSIYKQDDNQCPLNLTCFKDIEEGLAHAKEVNKPVILDFTGWACVNCRKMEENIWSQPDIYKMLSNNFIIISLYVDDHQKMLSKEEQFDYIKPNGKLKRIRTYGDKWATLQTANFKIASQPFYVALSPNLEVLNSPEQYTDKDTYEKWLKTSINRFKEIN